MSLVLGVPGLHALELSFLLVKVDVETFSLGSCLPEVQVDFGVETSGETLLLGQLVVVEVGVEIRDGLLSNVARAHAVVEDDSSGTVHVHSLVDHVLRVHSDATDPR